mgnify:CR=1 FL=1
MTLALIAGEGALPGLVYDACKTPPYVAALQGFPPKRIPHNATFRIEQLGSFIAELKARGVTEVCFAGAVRRPPLDPSAVDAATMPLVPRMMQALQEGDDAALRTVLSFFEEAGLTVRAAHELRPDLLLSSGVPTKSQPDDQARTDADRAAHIVAAMGAADIGQACIVAKGQVLGIETVMGTDWMVNMVAFFRATNLHTLMANTTLRFLPGGEAQAKKISKNTGIPLADAMGFPEDLNRGGILYKAPKPAQDMRIDVPTIGVDSIRAAAAAGLDGIVIVAGGVMVIDRDATLAEADQLGLFLWVQEP